MKCDYDGCNNPVREQDKTLKPETKKYCDTHGAEVDAIIKNGKAVDIFKWWVKSLGTTYEKKAQDDVAANT